MEPHLSGVSKVICPFGLLVPLCQSILTLHLEAHALTTRGALTQSWLQNHGTCFPPYKSTSSDPVLMPGGPALRVTVTHWPTDSWEESATWTKKRCGRENQRL